MKNIIIGTAGHIDHGKTTLIKALTGRDTDTLEEEKKRGISINLGFTYFDLPNSKRAGIVDVPGHEKFIKNMLAGASGIDIVLFVVASDEGVMPQTIEHLDILSFLNIKKGIIVLTKSDTVDDEFKQLVKDDIREKTKGTFLENADILEVDSISKKGINELIKKIDIISNDIDEKNGNSPARLNIDRVFSVKGFGTVVTGTLMEGKISVDDDLIVYPKMLQTKIRSIQVHGENVKTAYAGQRTAINISNIKVEELKRGDVLASPNSLEDSMMLDIKLSLVKHSNKSIKHWDRLRLYHGTREILCRVVPLDKDIVKPGESCYAQLRLEESIVSKKLDNIVLRNYSPLETIGGGIILDTKPKKHKRFDESIINSLKIKEKGEIKDILEVYLKNNLKSYHTLKDIMSYSGENESIIKNAIDELINANKVVNISNIYMHINQYKNLKESIVQCLNDYHKKYRLRSGMLKEELKSKVESRFKTKEMDILLEKLQLENIIKLDGNLVSKYDFDVKLNDKQREIKTIIQKQLKAPNTYTLLNINDICINNYYEEVLEYMIGKDIEKLDDAYVMDKEIYENTKNNLIEYLKENNEITLGQYRDILNSSRKNCMILLENFDRNKITKRDDNKRTLYNK
ncbi:selenocysteine-specific translation elongation factor [Romboutsia sp. 13368]|uniref:selenocysteine-specific translation elongation factor n=1 Tax=Romboutsia sp. 13368 TaxID=2708053 RepID=UPI0025D52432|nr:selenocysteine-specific translation elongation factor [Romboutsia sp. 13368]